MKVNVVMPKMGESLNEGTIIEWHKSVGDKVKKDEIIYEITTDKVDTEIPSPVDGVIVEIKVKEHETVPVDTVVAVIETDETVAESGESKLEEENVSKVFNEKKKNIMNEYDFAVKKKEKVENKFLSPLVLNIASKENIPIEKVRKIKGTGVNGRITKKDILNYIASREKIYKTAPDIRINEDDEIISMDTTRKLIMEQMVTSRDKAVHVTSVTEVNMGVIHNFLQKNKKRFLEEENIKLTYTTFIAHAVINAVKEFPLINSQISGNKIIVKPHVNLGIAVALEPNGLVVPNLKKSENLSMRGLAKGIAELGFNARNKKLKPEDVQEGTFSITNYGVFGVELGTPIINYPEVAILGVGSIVKKPVVIEVDGADVIAIKPMLYLTLSHDHRLIDGMLAGKFLNSVKKRLENFDLTNV